MGRLLISAAHTLENPGAIYQDLREADLTRKLLKLVMPHLDAAGVVYQTVPLDLPLLQRIEWINATGYSEQQGDIMVELHINDGGKRGIESWYKGSPAPDNKSQKLSERLAEYISEKQGYINIGAKSEYEHELTSLLIINSINPSGTALELLFIDSEEDIAILKDDQKMDALAKVVAEAIKDYLDHPDKTAKNPAIIQAPQVNQEQNQQQAQIQTNAAQFPAAPLPQNPMGNMNPGSFSGFGGNAAPQRNFGAGFGSGGNSFGGGFGGIGGAGTGGNKATLMDRDERKKMIKEKHQLILGKDPKPADENYYLNTGMTEAELINKLLESEDFKKMKENATKFQELDTKVKQLESKNETLEANIADSKELQETNQRLLEQKNIMINRLYMELVNHGIIQTGEHLESRKASAQKPQGTQTSGGKDTIGKKITKLVMRFTKV